jgi:hypothetical protein
MCQPGGIRASRKAFRPRPPPGILFSTGPERNRKAEETKPAILFGKDTAMSISLWIAAALAALLSGSDTLTWG